MIMFLISRLRLQIRCQNRNVIALLIAALFPASAFAEIPLAQGDQIQVTIAGLPDMGFEAIISENGTVNLAWFGVYQTQNKVMSELEREVKSKANGRIIKQYSRDGTLYLIQLEDDDVFIERIAYKPIIVSGAVTDPGEYTFSPSMTVRDAVALAGGAINELLDNNIAIDATQIVRWQNDYGLASFDYAEALITSWRINAELSHNSEAAAPNKDTTKVSDEIFEQIIQTQRLVLELNLEQEVREQAFFAKSQVQMAERIDILTRQIEQLQESLDVDRVEEQRIADLIERGLAASTRASDARRSTVQSATRLLEVEDDLARTKLDITRLARQASADKEDRLRALLVAKATASTAMSNARFRMDVASKFLGMSGVDIVSSTIAAEFNLAMVIHRNVDGEAVKKAAEMDSVLFPGDTLEISYQELGNTPVTE